MLQEVSPVQEGTIGLFDNSFLCPADFVPLLHVWDCPGLLDLTQLLQPIIETLFTEKLSEHPVCYHISTLILLPCPADDQEVSFLRQICVSQSTRACSDTIQYLLTLKRSFIICLSLSLSCNKEGKDLISSPEINTQHQRLPTTPHPI